MKNSEKKLLSDTFIFTVGNIGSKMIQFFLVPLYTYSMTTEEYGVSDLLFTTILVLMPIFSFSVVDGLLRFGLDKSENKDSVLKNVLVVAIVGSLLSIFCLLIFDKIKFIKEWKYLVVILLNSKIYQDLLATNLKIRDKNKEYAFSSILATFLLCLFSIIFLKYMHLGICGYMYAQICSSLIVIIFLLWKTHLFSSIKAGIISTKKIKEILVYSIPLIVNALAGWILTVCDRYMIQYFLQDGELGIYTVATKIPSILSTFTGIFIQAWTISAISELENDKKNIFYSKIHKIYFEILIFLITFIISVIKPFMYIYVNKAYFFAWKYVPLLLSSTLLISMINFYGGIYVAYKKNIAITITILFGAVINIILNDFMIQNFGVMGAVVATYFSWITVFVLRLMGLRKFCDLNIKYKEIIWFGMLNLLQCICVIKLKFIDSFLISVGLILYYIIHYKRDIAYVVRMIKTRINR